MLGSATLCPQPIQDALTRWADHGVLPGVFLQAILANDLRAAVAHGERDYLEQETLSCIVSFVYWELPSECHGSRSAVEAWVRKCYDRQKKQGAMP